MGTLKMGVLQEPHLYRPSSQVVTRRQLNQAPARRWSREMKVPLAVTRKTWERIFVIQSLYSRGCLGEASSGLGFGVGADPMIPAMVHHGCNIVATDYAASSVGGWGTGLDLDPRQVAGVERMARHVTTRSVDMNDIPNDLRGFDFTFSCGSLEHIGSLEKGFNFVEESMACLRPGGFAVHTTELNLSGGTNTLDVHNLGFYLPSSVDSLFERLREKGHRVAPMNYFSGTRSDDLHIARRPYPAPSLKVEHSGFHVTSMGFVIQAGTRHGVPPFGPSVRAVSDLATDVWQAARRHITAFRGERASAQR